MHLLVKKGKREMQKYFYTLNSDGSIFSLVKAKKCSTGIEITKTDYDKYRLILSSIENRDGYDKVVKLYPDFTYSVEYVPIEEIIVDEDEE